MGSIEDVELRSICYLHALYCFLFYFVNALLLFGALLFYLLSGKEVKKRPDVAKKSRLRNVESNRLTIGWL